MKLLGGAMDVHLFVHSVVYWYTIHSICYTQEQCMQYEVHFYY